MAANKKAGNSPEIQDELPASLFDGAVLDELRDKGVCAQSLSLDDIDMFFKKGEYFIAKLWCGGCSVKDLCLKWALDNNEEYGVWGGLDESERRAILSFKGA